MEKEKSDVNKLGFLLDSLHNRMKSDILILHDGFDILEHKRPSSNGCKSKKELRKWVQEQNRLRQIQLTEVLAH